MYDQYFVVTDKYGNEIKDESKLTTIKQLVKAVNFTIKELNDDNFIADATDKTGFLIDALECAGISIKFKEVEQQEIVNLN